MFGLTWLNPGVLVIDIGWYIYIYIHIRIHKNAPTPWTAIQLHKNLILLTFIDNTLILTISALINNVLIRRKEESHLCFYRLVLNSVLYFTLLKLFLSVIFLIRHFINSQRGQNNTIAYDYFWHFNNQCNL